MSDNLLGIPETRLPVDPAARLLDEGVAADQVAAANPTSSLAWATLAEDALADGRTVEGYAYARTGYHRALDALRRNGWRGQGPVPWEHEPNRGFLRSLAVLSRAAGLIGETDEERRCADFLRDSSTTGARELGL
ncbi:DUF3151 domain-containing protein [Knoellia sp. CPCC 206450]|uniref:DUF3151 domain-containing protein n=2 Tax=Knoellia flava TaxID=913969 RepID=A0A8H9KRA6_9MICO|nr:DUF3151 domain-containing protein [Knoellia flava]KGN35874.1 hypothetical protein N798_01175 [Knoellia flava TL1]GGB79920.1 hypothetical protein GCM10011314_19430 [Knoellia flava]